MTDIPSGKFNALSLSISRYSGLLSARASVYALQRCTSIGPTGPFTPHSTNRAHASFGVSELTGTPAQLNVSSGVTMARSDAEVLLNAREISTRPTLYLTGSRSAQGVSESPASTGTLYVSYREPVSSVLTRNTGGSQRIDKRPELRQPGRSRFP